MITSNAQNKIVEFNSMGLHYNLVAGSIYEARSSLSDLFGEEYLPFIVAGLISFDMGRMMGKGANLKYDIELGGFATRLFNKLQVIKPWIENLVNEHLVDADLAMGSDDIAAAYEELAGGGHDSLHHGGKRFPVGATKILHFINPELFIIVDSNAARAFRSFHSVDFKNTTQPGYSSVKYMKCMSCAKQDIIDFGISDFRSLEPNTPIARVYDKLTFVTGASMV